MNFQFPAVFGLSSTSHATQPWLGLSIALVQNEVDKAQGQTTKGH